MTNFFLPAFKLEEQLTAYLNGNYKDSANVRQSCSQARGQIEPLEQTLQDPKRAARIINARSGPPVKHRVASGFDILSDTRSELNLSAFNYPDFSSQQCIQSGAGCISDPAIRGTQSYSRVRGKRNNEFKHATCCCEYARTPTTPKNPCTDLPAVY